MGHRRCLRHPEPLDDDRPGGLFEIMDHLDRQRRAPGEGPLDAAHVRLFQIRVVQHPDIHGRNQRRKGGTVEPDRLEQRLGLGTGNQALRKPHVNRVIHRGGQAEDVKVGQRPEHDLRSGFEFREPRLDLLDLLAQVCVGEHDPLGDAGRPAGVLIHGHILEAGLHGRRVGGVFAEALLPAEHVRGRLHVGKRILLQPPSQDPFDGGQIIADAGVDDLLDLRLGPERDHALDEQVHGDQGLGAGIIELVLQLRIRIERVVHHNDPPDFQDREVGGDAGNDVGQQDRHGIPFFDPEIGQTGSETIRHLLELTEGDGRPLEKESRLVGKLFRRPVQHIRHADLFILDKFRNALFIGLQPQLFLIPRLSHSRPPSLLFC